MGVVEGLLDVGGDGDLVACGGVGYLAVAVENAVGGGEGKSGEEHRCVGAGEGEPAFLGSSVGREEGYRNAVRPGGGGGADALLADVQGVAEEVEVVVDESGAEDVEVEEAGKVGAGVVGERVAHFGGAHVAKGFFIHKAGDGGIEEGVAEVAAQRMPHEGPFVVGGRAVGERVGHWAEGVVAAVGDMGGADHILEVFLIEQVGSFAAVGGFAGHFAAERGAALVEPHVAFGAAGYEVAEPGVRQLVGDGDAAVLRHGACHEFARKGDVVDVLHRAFPGGYIADAVPAVGAEAALEHRDDGVELEEGLGHHAAVLGGEAEGEWVSGCGGVDFAEVGLAYRHQVGGGGVVELPDAVFAAEAVGFAASLETAAFGGPSGPGFDTEGIEGFVGEVVAAGEHGAPDGMGVFVEGHAEVVGHVVVEMESAPAVALHVVVSGILYSDGDRCVGLDAGHRYLRYVGGADG